MVKEKFASLGLGLTKVLLPSKSIDYNKWSVVACDQFTSDRTYWKDVERIVGNSPSTLNMIFSRSLS
jgi:actin-like ATPase involved in cell morphogenesis